METSALEQCIEWVAGDLGDNLPDERNLPKMARAELAALMELREVAREARDFSGVSDRLRSALSRFDKELV